MDLPDSAQQLIESSGLAHLVTLNEDGSPQVSIVWVGFEDGEGSSPMSRATRRSTTSSATGASRSGSRPTASPTWACANTWSTTARRGSPGRRRRAARSPRPDLPRRGLGLPPDADQRYVTRIEVRRVAGNGPRPLSAPTPGPQRARGLRPRSDAIPQTALPSRHLVTCQCLCSICARYRSMAAEVIWRAIVASPGSRRLPRPPR